MFAGGDVFGKQARLVFAEFLPFFLVFPLEVGPSGVGVTIGLCEVCLSFDEVILPSLVGFGNC